MTRTTSVADGDKLYDILERYGVFQLPMRWRWRALGPVFELQSLRKGQQLTLGTSADGQTTPQSLVLDTARGEVEVTRDGNNQFVARTSAIVEAKRDYRRSIVGIEGSLYRTAREQGVPDSVIVKMMHAHSYDVDFQREIHAGDPFEVFYIASDAGSLDSAERDQILFSSLTTNDKTRSYYRFTTVDGVTDYYDVKSVSSKKPLTKTTVNGARMSSGFGMRRHLILGYTKMHGGTDFAVPSGTPILAAGDGKVEMAGRNGAARQLRETEAQGRPEDRLCPFEPLCQGHPAGQEDLSGRCDRIVGSTGASTGPHLHYEVHINGKKKNPLTVKVAGGGRKLEGNELVSLETERKRIGALRAEAPVEAPVAAAQP